MDQRWVPGTPFFHSSAFSLSALMLGKIHNMGAPNRDPRQGQSTDRRPSQQQVPGPGGSPGVPDENQWSLGGLCGWGG